MNRTFLLLALALTGCGSPGTGSNLFNTGRDARVYDAATGRYEWPDGEPRKQTRHAPTARTPAQPADSAEGRAYNAATGRWE